MSIAIVACPKCSTLLLNDTVQCHRCRHVLRPELAGRFRDNALPSDAAVQEDLETCKQCGETYRKGLVRCWSCGAFTRPEIEESYYRLLRGHAHSMAIADQHHELPEISQEEARLNYLSDEERSLNLSGRNQSEIAAVDEDFELSGNISLRDGATVTAAEPSPAPADPVPEVETDIPAAPVSEDQSPATNGAAVAKKTDSDASPPPVADEATSLLNIAKQEETDTHKARKARMVVGSFVIFCPMGCKIRVQERHRGKVGRCPKCQATFVVPMARQTALSGSVPATSPEGAPSPDAAASTAASSKYTQWLEDVHLHRVVMQKLRIKADSLLNDFQDVDVGFDPQGLLLVTLPKPAGMFGGKGGKKKEDARAAVKDHLATKPTLEGLPAAFQQELARDTLGQLTLTQPTPPGTESLFGDILVFGTGRIALRLPKFDEKTTAYLSFTLSQFRKFAQLVESVFGMTGYGAGCGIPLQDEYQTAACHFSKAPVKELQHLSYYQKDAAFKLEVSGYRCKTCSTVISEAARATQKLGGANGKGIAKAKCPKCTKLLGSQVLYTVPASQAPSASLADEESASPDTSEAAAPVTAPA